jgi:hypothetical protein
VEELVRQEGGSVRHKGGRISQIGGFK